MKMLKKGNAATQFRSGHEAAENGKKGGLASGVSRKKQKELRTVMVKLLESYCSDPELLKKTRAIGLKKDRITNSDVIAAALISKALNGDVKAFEIIRDTIGEKPLNNVLLQQTSIEVSIIDDK